MKNTFCVYVICTLTRDKPSTYSEPTAETGFRSAHNLLPINLSLMLLSKSARNVRPNSNLQFRSGIPVNIFFFPCLFIPLHPQNVFLSKSPKNKSRLENKAKLQAFVLLSTLLKIEWQIAQYDNDGNTVKNWNIYLCYLSLCKFTVNSQWGQKCAFCTHKKTHMVTFPWVLYKAKHQPLYVTVGLQNLLLCCSQLWPCAHWTYAAHQSTCHCRRLLELSRSDGSWGTLSTYSPDFAGRPCHSESKQNSWGSFNNTTLTLFLSGKEEQCSNWEAGTFTTSTS